MNDWFDAERHVEKAHEYYEAGQWDAAENELRDALALNPYQPEWHFNLGLTLDAAAKHAEAVAAFKAAHKLKPDDPQALLMVGSSLLAEGKSEEALPWLEKAEALSEKDSAQALVHKVEAFAHLGRHAEAEEAFYLAQQIEPEHPDLYVGMAESLLAQGKHDRAVWCLREAARLDPSLVGINARLADAYAQTGRQERARQLYLLELRRDPGDIDTLLDLGDLLVEMARYIEAGEKFRRVLELEPDNIDAHFALGDLAERAGDRTAAATSFDVVVRLDTTFPEARARLAALLLDEDRPDAAVRARTLLRGEKTELLKELAEVEGRLSDELRERVEELGGLMLDAQLAGEVVKVLEAAVEAEPNHAGLRHLLSVAQLETGRTAAGIEQAREALRLDGRMVPAMHNLALANLELGRTQRARYWASQASSIDPDDPAIRRLRLRLMLRFWAGAFAAVRRLLSGER